MVSVCFVAIVFLAAVIKEHLATRFSNRPSHQCEESEHNAFPKSEFSDSDVLRSEEERAASIDQNPTSQNFVGKSYVTLYPERCDNEASPAVLHEICATHKKCLELTSLYSFGKSFLPAPPGKMAFEQGDYFRIMKEEEAYVVRRPKRPNPAQVGNKARTAIELGMKVTDQYENSAEAKATTPIKQLTGGYRRNAPPDFFRQRDRS